MGGRYPCRKHVITGIALTKRHNSMQYAFCVCSVFLLYKWYINICRTLIITIIVFLIITYCKVSNKFAQLSYMAYNYQLGMSFHVFNNTTSFQFFKESRRCTWNDYHHVVTRWKKKAFDAMQRTKKKVLFFTINRLLSEIRSWKHFKNDSTDQSTQTISFLMRLRVTISKRGSK